MSTEMLIETDLIELLGGITPPDLIERTLARIEASADAPEESKDARILSIRPARATQVYARIAAAACVLLAVALIAWVIWPRPLPESVIASGESSYLVRNDHIELKQGWLLLTDGAPEVRTQHGRVSFVQGRVVAGTAIPDEAALDSLADQLQLSASERAMFKQPNRWLTAGGLALCVLTGQAMLNDTLVQADDLPAPIVKDEEVEIPKSDDIEGVRKLVRSAVRVEVMVDGKATSLDDLFDVRRITEALTAEGFAVSDKALNWDPYDGVTMFLKDGRKIITSGLSWEEDVFDLGLPGMEGMQTYGVPGGAHDVLRPYFERAKRAAVAAPQNFKVLREWSGADSKITQRRVEIITDTESWASVWTAHANNPADDPSKPRQLPEVDFATELVIAVFAGSSFNSRGYFVHEILENGGVITVRVDETTYQTMNGADAVTPYGLFVLPRKLYEFAVEENAQGLLNEPPLWKWIGAFELDGDNDLNFGWQETFSREDVGGPGGNEFRVIYNQDQWDAAIKDIGLMDAIWPSPDFSKSIGFFAFGARLKVLNDRMTLRPAGANGTKTVVRLDSPVAKTDSSREYKNVYGIWLYPRPGRDVVLERPFTSPDETTCWLESGTYLQKDIPFGVNYVESGLSGGAKEAKFGLAHNQAEFVALCETMEIRVKRSADWVNWDTENIIVALPGEIRISGGLETTTTTDNGVHTITYHLFGTSGEDPGIKRPYMLIKIPKTDATIILKQSEVAGPAPAEVTEVARFEK